MAGLRPPALLFLVLLATGSGCDWRSSGNAPLVDYQSIPPVIDPSYVPLGGYQGAFWFVQHDTLFAIDVPSDTVRLRRSVAPATGVFEDKYEPRGHSATIDIASGTAWMWDGTVGSVVQFGLATDQLRTFPKYSSRVQGAHGGGLHPVTGRPLVFGGFGYYRVHDLMLTFDDRARTWVEVATKDPERPEARMSPALVTGWHPTKVVLVGGTGPASDELPARFNRPIDDAWIFDFADSTWAPVDLPEPVRCAVQGTRITTDPIVEPESHSVIVYASFGCPPDPSHDTGLVLRWFPESGHFDTAAALGQAIPVGLAFIGLVRDRDRGRFHLLFADPRSDDALVRMARQVITVENMTGAATAVEQTSIPAGTWALLLALAVPLAVLLWLVARRRNGNGAVSVEIADEGAPITLRCGRRARSQPLSPNSHRLLAALLEMRPSRGNVISSDELFALFDDLYGDPDSSRVAKNRAVDEVNALFKTVCRRPLLIRVRRKDDARRFDWEVGVELR